MSALQNAINPKGDVQTLIHRTIENLSRRSVIHHHSSSQFARRRIFETSICATGCRGALHLKRRMGEAGAYRRASTLCGKFSLPTISKPSRRNSADISKGKFLQPDRQFEFLLDRQSSWHKLTVRLLRNMWLNKPRTSAVFALRIFSDRPYSGYRRELAGKGPQILRLAISQSGCAFAETRSVRNACRLLAIACNKQLPLAVSRCRFCSR